MSVSLSIIFDVVPVETSAWKPEIAPHAIVMKTNGKSAPGMIGRRRRRTARRPAPRASG
jgi:hypothetical protein